MSDEGVIVDGSTAARLEAGIDLRDIGDIDDIEAAGPYTPVVWTDEGWSVDLEEPVVTDFNGGPAPHLDTCECQQCRPPDLRPLPPLPTDFPDCERLLDLFDASRLLNELDGEWRVYGLPPAVHTVWGPRWSEIEIRWWVQEAAWCARHTQ